MRASAIEFRLRYLLHGIVYTLGFWAPWNGLLHLDPAGVNAHVWGLLAVNLTRLGLSSLFTAFNILLVIATACALGGAALRTWGSAYLGAGVVQSTTMHTAARQGDGILKDGPFGYLRNPLYVGTFLHSLALALLMPRSGAIFTVVVIGLMQVRLALGEEAFLRQKLGVAYAAYCAKVPRFFPRLRRAVVSDGLVPRWGQALLGEAYFWGVAASFAVLGWRYNASLLMQCVVVCVGVSLVLGALTWNKGQERVER